MRRLIDPSRSAYAWLETAFGFGADIIENSLVLTLVNAVTVAAVTLVCASLPGVLDAAGYSVVVKRYHALIWRRRA